MRPIKISLCTFVLALSVALLSCQSQAAPTQAPAPTKPAVAPPTQAAPAAAPTVAASKPAAPAATATPAPAAVKPVPTVAPAAPARKYEFFQGSISQVSSFYTVAVAVAKSVNDNVPGVHVTVVETGGGVANLKGAMSGEYDTGFITTLETGAMAYQGKMQFAKPFTDLRWWVNYTLVPMYNVVRSDSGVKMLADLNGKKFSAGAPGSTTESITKVTMEALGIKPDWYLGSLADSVTAIKDRRAVGYAKGPVGYQLDATTLDIQQFTPVTLLGYTEEQIKKALTAFPGIVRVDVPAGVIKALPNSPALISWGVVGGGFMTTKIPQDVGYRMTKAVIESWRKNVVAAFPPSADYDPIKDTIAALSNTPNPPPFHAGTVQYFEERGARVPANLIPPEYKK